MDNDEKLRIALVGGAGFIGHNLALTLKDRGYDVAIIDGLQVNNYLAFQSTVTKRENSKFYAKMIQERLDLLHEADIPLYVQDAREYHALSKIMTAIAPDVVIHLAAVAHAGKSNKDPYSTFDHSLRTLENTLDASRDIVKHFIYFSSSMVYGNFVDGAVTEESICEPIGIYGALKFAGEKLVIAYNQVFDIPYTVIRPSALYGERCVSRRVGQIFIENALNSIDISVEGDGADRLDFTYIQDLIDGVECVIRHNASRNQIFNLTYGHGRSINDMLAILRDHFPAVNVSYKSRDKLMPKRGTLSIDKARNVLGYEPAYPLEKGFVQYINWYQEKHR